MYSYPPLLRLRFDVIVYVTVTQHKLVLRSMAAIGYELRVSKVRFRIRRQKANIKENKNNLPQSWQESETLGVFMVYGRWVNLQWIVKYSLDTSSSGITDRRIRVESLHVVTGRRLIPHAGNLLMMLIRFAARIRMSASPQGIV